jgi:hypothetical protein
VELANIHKNIRNFPTVSIKNSFIYTIKQSRKTVYSCVGLKRKGEIRGHWSFLCM